MAAMPEPPPAEFRALSAALGRDRMRVQGPGGNTSIKRGDAMWIKASGFELAEATERDVFVAVDVVRARSEITPVPGAPPDPAMDGTCRAAVIDPSAGLRPSIETTFHALLPWRVVLHTHSVATLAHAVSDRGIAAAMEKLDGLDAVCVHYAKPGLPLTRAIKSAMVPEASVFVLRNHGLVVCADTVEDATTLMDEVERRLHMPVVGDALADTPPFEPPAGWRVVPWAAPLAHARLREAVSGTLYPDHAVFLGPGVGTLPDNVSDGQAVAVMPGRGTLIREGASAVQETMLRCLVDVLVRVPLSWGAEPIGEDAEAELLNWDAETYRQKLAAQAAEHD